MQSTYILSRKIQKLSNTITQRRNRDLKKLGLTAEQADALLFFRAHPESAAADLKTHLSVTHQAARAIVERMVNKGLLITRVSSHDARYKVVTLTAQGETIFKELHTLLYDWDQAVCKNLSDIQREQLLELLRLVTDSREDRKEGSEPCTRP